MQNRWRTVVLGAGVTLSLSAAVLAWPEVRGNGKFVDEKRDVGAFHGISIESGINAELRLGDAKAVEIHAEENVLPLVETEVRGGTLHVRFARHSSLSTDGVRVKITAAAFDRIETSGGSQVEGEAGKSDTLRIEASGGAQIHLKKITASTVQAEASGGAVLELEGKTDELTLEASGGTVLTLGRLSTQVIRIDASGGCTGEVNASELVRGAISGGVALRVSGGAKTRVSSSGGSSVDVD